LILKLDSKINDLRDKNRKLEEQQGKDLSFPRASCEKTQFVPSHHNEQNMRSTSLIRREN
jgi:hypothetical protein